MNWLQALLLGLVQGLSEYLPISSSGHLEIFREILKIDLPSDEILMFDVMVHAATVCSTLVVLWPMFSKLCKSFFGFKKDENFYYVCKILLSCVPVGIVGVFFKDTVEQFFGNGLFTVGCCLCVTAILLSFAYFTSLNKENKIVSAESGRDIGWLDALIIGCGQAIAVLPGLSRSGTTIATGILLRNKRGQVASFSFLMVILPILGQALLDIKDMISPDELTTAAAQNIGAMPLIVGFIVSFVAGCLACKWMIDLVKRGKLIWFAIYCLAVGILCLVW